MSITELQKARRNSKKLAAVMMNPRSTVWSRGVQFISDVKDFIRTHLGEVCIVACKNKKKTEKLLAEYGIPKERVELVGFPEVGTRILAEVK